MIRNNPDQSEISNIPESTLCSVHLAILAKTTCSVEEGELTSALVLL